MTRTFCEITCKKSPVRIHICWSATDWHDSFFSKPKHLDFCSICWLALFFHFQFVTKTWTFVKTFCKKSAVRSLNLRRWPVNENWVQFRVNFNKVVVPYHRVGLRRSFQEEEEEGSISPAPSEITSIENVVRKLSRPTLWLYRSLAISEYLHEHRQWTIAVSMEQNWKSTSIRSCCVSCDRLQLWSQQSFHEFLSIQTVI